MPDVLVTIDGCQVSVPQGSTILQAAEAAGVKIPTLCHHPALQPIGACRMCLVEVEKQRVLQPACTFPVSAGMVVHTASPNVISARRFVLELLLSDHPLDCMTCESGGSCELQDLAYEYGVQQTRFPGVQHDWPLDNANPFIVREYNKCILCRRCVRACQEINGVEAIGLINRGFDSKVGAAYDAGLEDSPCEFCGMCVAVCPTGALVPKQAAGRGRAWQTKGLHHLPLLRGGLYARPTRTRWQDRQGGLQLERAGQPRRYLREGTLWVGLCRERRAAHDAADPQGRRARRGHLG